MITITGTISKTGILIITGTIIIKNGIITTITGTMAVIKLLLLSCSVYEATSHYCIERLASFGLHSAQDWLN
ncbi:hypothetical protein [Legionella wadsworthii]|uniref:hypothetical protein n=1 Tax=Legionella wadsworthii TaxID=28088 RepID=UPI0010553A41|nr:hypothetical protein [Legionella wadsworthii]